MAKRKVKKIKKKKAKKKVQKTNDSENGLIIKIKSDWVKKALKWKIKYPIVLEEFRKQKKYVNPYFFMEKFYQLF